MVLKLCPRVATTRGAALLEARDIAFAYPAAAGEQPAGVLNGATFAIGPGEVVAVTGANGAGKSTLARVLCGTLVPAQGELLLDGKPVTGAALHRVVGFVRQDPESQLVASLVADELAFGPRNLGLSEQELRQRVEEALRACGLAGYARRLVQELSGGEMQRVAIAGVLAMHPRYLVLDEAGSQLDGSSREQLRAIIRRLAAAGTGIVLVTHDPDDLREAGRVAVMEQGRVARFEAPEAAAGSLAARIRAGARRAGAPRAAGGLELRDVSVRYGERAAASGVTLAAAPGRITLLAGPSGSGKSTLACVAAGVLAPDAGEARVAGRPVRAGMVGLCLQRAEDQLFCDTVLEDVEFGPKNLGVPAAGARERAKRACARMGVPASLWGRSPFALSGGQRRRVGLAGMLAMEPAAYVLDEPTVGLDIEGREQLHAAVLSLAAAGHAVMVVSHDLGEWLGLADDVALLRGGRLCWQGEAAQLERDAAPLAQAGLMLPRWLTEALAHER